MKLIAVSQRQTFDSKTHERRDCLDVEWHKLLSNLNCVAIPIPNNIESCKYLLESIAFDGILLTGGNTPVTYGGDSPEKDVIDQMLISHAISNDLPLIGVCRGMQSIALYFGDVLKRVSNHVSTIHSINGATNRKVNSYHEWAICGLSEELMALATSSDGTIEMIKHTSYKIIGMMWHPERVIPYSDEDLEIFKNQWGIE